MNRVLLILLILMSALSSPSEAASLDEVQSRLLGYRQLALRWDNVEGAPAWLGGVHPAYNFGYQMHTVRLARGQFIAVWAPAFESLRIHSPAGAISTEDLEISLSDGSGLYRSVHPLKSADGRSLLISPQTAKPLIGRVTAKNNEILEIALFVSRVEPLGTIAPYRQLLRFPESAVSLRGEGNPMPEDFWPFTSDAPKKVSVRGPARLVFESRLQYAPSEKSRNAAYRATISVDGALGSILELETAPETEQVILVDGRAATLGRLKKKYLEIPEGEHLLAVETSANLYGRILLQSDPDYLLPALNSPDPSSRKIREDLVREQKDSSLWSAGKDGSQYDQAQAYSLLEMERLVLREARDNSRKDGGMVAQAIALGAAQKRRDYPAVQTFAEEVKVMHTSYRLLLPEEKQGGAQRLRWFAEQSLKEADEGFWGRVVAEQHLNESISLLKQGAFIDLPLLSSGALCFNLPERFSPSTLLVALDAPDDEFTDNIMLQLDEEEPVLMRIADDIQLERKRLDLSPGEAGLNLLRLRRNSMEPLTLGAPFSMRKNPAPLIQVRSVEIDLPRKHSRIKIWREGKGKGVSGVALYLRMADSFTLSESEYLAEIKRVEERGSTFAKFTAFINENPINAVLPSGENALGDNREIPVREIGNAWLPLRRLIRSLDQGFSFSVWPSTPRQTPAPPASAESMRMLSIRAARAAKAGQWLIALELQSELYNKSSGPVRDDAALARVEALGKLGEAYTARRLCRGMILYGENDVIRERAYHALERILQDEEDVEGLLLLQGAALKRMPTKKILRSFVESLFARRNYQAALSAALLLPAEERPRLTMIRAAYRLGWWQVFDALLADHPDRDGQNTWQGQRLAEQGKYEAAAEMFARGDRESKKMERAFADALVIRNQILSTEKENRMKGLRAWQSWQRNYPGPRLWQEEPQSIQNYAGGRLVYSIAGHTYAQTYLSSGKKPVTLRLMGPVKLLIEARPVLAFGAQIPVDGWLKIVNQGSLSIFPLNDMLPQEGLRIVGDPDHTPGRLVSAEIQLGPGLQELEVSGEPLDVLLTVYAERPELPSPILAPLTPDTALAALHGLYQAGDTALAFKGLVSGCRDCLSVITADSARVVTLKIDSDKSKRLPFSGQTDAERQSLAFLSKEFTDFFQEYTGNDLFEHSGKGLPPVPAALRGGKLQTGDIEGALAGPFAKNTQGALSEAAMLLWLAEKEQDKYPEVVARAEFLGRTYPENSQLRSIINRLTKQAGWEPVASVLDSAGLRYVELSGWEPASPRLRIKKALLGIVAKEEYVLSGDGTLALSLITKQTLRLRLRLSSEEVAYLVPEAVNIWWQLDNQAQCRRTLTPAKPILNEEINIPAGRHTLRIALEQRVADQYLKVRVDQLEKNSFAGEAFVPLIHKVEVPYYVVTKREPLQVSVAGPAWIRVDTFKDGHTDIRYRFVATGRHNLLFSPRDGEAENLIRIFQRIIDPEKPQLPPRFVALSPESVPEPRLPIPDAVIPRKVTLRDDYRLGRQEDGTLSVGASYVQRNSTDDEDGGSDQREAFGEMDGDYRFFWKDKRSYTNLGFFGRVRENGGPTYGLGGYLFYQVPRRPYVFNLDSALFLQDPQGASCQFFSGSPEWAATLKGSFDAHLTISEKTFHTPSFSVFGRALSLSGFGKYASGDVDQDIFTSYKADHQLGAKLSETFHHKPWLDTIWYGGAAVVTNDDFYVFGPDHLALHAGWKQLLGAFRLDAMYRHTHYFNDRDRTSSLDRGALNLVFTWEMWLFQQHRLEAGMHAKYSTDSGRIFPSFSLIWHMGEGRAYRDFRPRDVEFLDIRQRRIPQEENNEVVDETK